MGFLEGKTAIITGAGVRGAQGRIRRFHRLRHRHRLRQGGREPGHHRPQREEAGDGQGEAGGRIRHPGALRGAYVNAGADNQAVVQNVIDQTIEKFGRIDVLVNNAQASASGVTLADHTTDQFDLAIYSGLYATFYYMQACYPYLKETKGSVINFASGAGLFGNFGQCAYAAAKEGIRGMSRVAATEWGPDGINVNVVCPLAWDGRSGELPGGLPRRLRGQRAHASHGPLWRCGEGDRPCGGAAGQPRLQVHERRDPDPGRRHGPAPVILLAFHKHMF